MQSGQASGQVYAGIGLIRLTYVRQWRVQASHLLLYQEGIQE